MKVVKFTPTPPPSWDAFFTSNREALDEELRQLVAELLQRLADALIEGDTDAARDLWDDGELAEHIALVLRDGR